MPKASSTDWSELALELRRIGRILAVISMQNTKTQRDQIKILDEMGFVPSEIAKIVGTTPNTVNVALHELRRSRRKVDNKKKVAKAKS